MIDFDEVLNRYDAAKERLEWLLKDTRSWAFGLICRVIGHRERVRGDWPEDHVCPRCGDLEVCSVFTMEVVPTLDQSEATDSKENT